MTRRWPVRRLVGYAALGLALYAGFLVANAPAVWLAQAATRVSNGVLTLERTAGTLWRGSGQLHAGGSASGTRHLGTLRWRIDPWWLFLGRLHVRLDLDGAATRGRAALHIAPRRHIEVQELFAALPADIAGLIYGPAAFFEPSGVIELRAPAVELSAAGLRTNLEVQWQGAGARFAGPAALGDYRIDVNGAGETVAIRLTTLRGDLELAGQGQWRVTGDGRLHFSGTATPRGNAARLEPLLRPLGRDLGGGRREIRLNARFPLVEQLGLS